MLGKQLFTWSCVGKGLYFILQFGNIKSYPRCNLDQASKSWVASFVDNWGALIYSPITDLCKKKKKGIWPNHIIHIKVGGLLRIGFEVGSVQTPGAPLILACASVAHISAVTAELYKSKLTSLTVWQTIWKREMEMLSDCYVASNTPT